MRKQFRAAALLPVLLAALFLPARAAAPVDVSRTGSLTLTHAVHADGQETPLRGVSFQLYRVGDMAADAKFSLTGDFSGYPVRVNDLDAAGWSAAAGTLAAYAGYTGVAPRQTVRTDDAGKAVFANLPTGLYLLTGENAAHAGTTYRVAPFLLSLPGWEDGWVYNVTANTKPDGTVIPPQAELRVIKVWNDRGHRDARPDYIEAVLLRDGAEFDRVTLNTDNFWRHTWSNLEAGHQWSVVEGAVPPGYQVTYTGNEAQLVITNTYRRNPPGGHDDPGNPPDKPHDPDTPDIPDVDIPEQPVPQGDAPPNTPGTPGDPEPPLVDIPDTAPPLTGLPQTGLLWWPVPALAAAGILLFSLGWWQRNGGRKNHEK